MKERVYNLYEAAALGFLMLCLIGDEYICHFIPGNVPNLTLLSPAFWGRPQVVHSRPRVVPVPETSPNCDTSPSRRPRAT